MYSRAGSSQGYYVGARIFQLDFFRYSSISWKPDTTLNGYENYYIYPFLRPARFYVIIYRYPLDIVTVLRISMKIRNRFTGRYEERNHNRGIGNRNSFRDMEWYKWIAFEEVRPTRKRNLSLDTVNRNLYRLVRNVPPPPRDLFSFSLPLSLSLPFSFFHFHPIPFPNLLLNPIKYLSFFPSL